MMARQVRPWLAKPAWVEAPRVRAIDWGSNQRIPSGTAAMPHQSPNVRLQSLPLRHRLLTTGKAGASMYDPMLRVTARESNGMDAPTRNGIYVPKWKR
jgi:hypothetical protein